MTRYFKTLRAAVASCRGAGRTSSCWYDTRVKLRGEWPRYSLYDESGLPAGPFEMAVR